MHWAAPAYGWLALLAVPATALHVMARRRRRRDMRRLTGEDAVSGKFTTLAVPLPALAFLLLVAALCRPQWGHVDVQRESRGLDIIVALDVSRSMLADDLAPNRLAVARAAVMELLPGLRGDRIGLIAFAGSAFLTCPPTLDYETFAAMLRETDTDAVPLGGTSLIAALDEAKRAFGAIEGPGKVLFLVSDGEDHGGDVTAAAAALRAAGVTVFSVVVGTPAGSLVRLADGEFLRDGQGALVMARPRTSALDRISAATGGRRVDLAADPRVLAGLYGDELSAMERREARASRRQLEERFQIPLAAALLLLLLEPLLAFRSRQR